MLRKILPTFNIYPKLFLPAIYPNRIEDRTTKIFDVLNTHERHTNLPPAKAGGLAQSGRSVLKSIRFSKLMR